MQLRFEISNKGVIKILLKPDYISVDMLDVVLDISDYDFEYFIEPIIRQYEFDIRLKFWESTKWNNYRYNWNFTNEGYSFYFAYSLNINKSLKNRLRISWNPNKVNIDDELLSYLLNMIRLNKPIIQSVDIAFDYMGVKTSDVVFDKGRKKEYKIFKYPNSSETIYIGSGDGRIKIYDKASEESGGNADYSKTRYEISIDVKTIADYIDEWECKVEIPPLYIQMELATKHLKPTDKLLLYAIKHGYPMTELTYEQRKKYDKLMKEVNYTYTKIEPSPTDIEKVIKEYINYLFNY